jgi:hypothetical protein
MACSTNQTESYVGVDLLEKSKADWFDDPDQRRFVWRICDALTAAPAQAYRGGQTTVVTGPSPTGASPQLTSLSPGGTS